MTFQDDLRNFINLTHAYAWNKVQAGKTPDEPSLISAFISPPMITELERLVRNHFKNKFKNKPMHVLINGIFTHKTPTVRPVTAKNSVEIADILFVRQHVSPAAGTFDGRAFLLQAKRNTIPNSGNVSKGNPKIQFDLYKDWPLFEGMSRISMGAAGGKFWNLKKTAVKGNPYGRYLVVFDGHAFIPPKPLKKWSGIPIVKHGSIFTGFAGNSTWGYGEINSATNAANGVPCNSDFSALLEGFVNGTVGVPFHPGKIDDADHWSTLLTELLNIAVSGNYTYLSSLTNVNHPAHRCSTISTLPAAIPVLGLIAQKYGIHWCECNALLNILANKCFSSWPKKEGLEMVKKVLTAAMHGTHRDVPPPDFGDRYPPEELGHPSVLSLITIGKECPKKLRQGK